MNQVTVVILNWNGKDFLEKFLPSVIKSTYPNTRILVVDNGSTDDSVAFTKKAFPEVDLLELPENYGFAEGNNKAIPYIDSPYFILLNSDVEVSPGWIEPLVAYMEAHPDMAACQPKIRAFHQKDHFEYAGAAGGFIDKFGYPFCRGRVFDTLEKDKGQYDEAREIFWATGAAMMLRKSVVDEIGLFEGALFAHMEEIDFCWRALNHGYRIGCEPKSVVYHVGGGTLPQGNPRKTFLNIRNGLILLFKNLPKGKVFSHLFARMILDGVFGIYTLLKGDTKTIGAILKAHGAFYRKLGFWRKRRREIYPVQPSQFPAQGFLTKSIVWQHFIKRKKTWNEVWQESK